MTSPAAPAIAGDTVIQIDELPAMPLPERVGCWGRTFQDWSQYLIAPAGLGTGVSAVIAFTQMVYVPAGLATAATVALGVAFVRISCLKPRRELEDEVNFFKDRLIDLTRQNNRLATNINALNETKKLIRNQVDEAKNTVRSLGEALKEEGDDFEAIASRMEISLEVVQRIAQTYQAFNESLQTLESEIEHYNAIRSQIAVAVKEFSGEVIELGQKESELSDEVDELSENVREIEENREGFRQQFLEFEEFGREVHGDVGVLRENVDQLEQIIPRIDTAPHRLDEEYRKLNESVKQLWDLVERGEKVFGTKK